MDHYKVLGLPKTATKLEIRDAFKKLALLHHPDKHSNSPQAEIDECTEKFRAICEAYDFLINDQLTSSSSPSTSSSPVSRNGVRRHQPKYKASGAFGDGEWTYEGDIDPQSIKNFFYGAAFAGVLLVGSVVLKVAKKVLD
ncbi:hypothetical protein MKW94_016291 [Papaver nudicaule]|uniref:J domain-containing protein n=1 Tax=Papaver nudicaule TaxID=74823 RepID=A0AA42B1D3_PAPNU|nr:hypothetical protein [Papaver nudicaule]